MPGRVPGIHAVPSRLGYRSMEWIAGTSPAVTVWVKRSDAFEALAESPTSSSLLGVLRDFVQAHYREF